MTLLALFNHQVFVLFGTSMIVKGANSAFRQAKGTLLGRLLLFIAAAYVFVQLLLTAVSNSSTPRNKNSAKASAKTNATMMGSPDYILVEEIKGNFKRFAAFDRSAPVSIAEWIELLSSSNHVIKFVEVMKEASSEYPAFFFETKGVSPGSASKQFEFVLVNSKSLHSFVQRGHDFDAFKEHFQSANREDVAATSVSFPNLGRTSTLIAPKPMQPTKDIYSHIGRFIRNAPKNEITFFFQLVGKQYRKILNESTGGQDKSVWLSTSGIGVAWLHMRIDDRPKYYTFKYFAKET